MALVAALAVISTQNSTINGLAAVCQGMSKTGMMPEIFQKTNKRGVPYVGVIFISLLIFFFSCLSDGSSEAISFLILVGSVFWMISYILIHVDLLVMRRQLPKAPRSFKVPGGIVIPVIAIAGIIYMILHISNDPAERNMIWLLTGGTMLILCAYSVIWIKFKMKQKIFSSVPIEKVMAMENELYHIVRRRIKENVFFSAVKRLK